MIFRPKRGDIWLANLGARDGAEPGKIRPVLVFQSQVLLDQEHKSTIAIPLTTQLERGTQFLRRRIHAAGDLHHDSDLMIDQIRALDNTRFVKGPLHRLSAEDMRPVEQAVCDVMGVDYEG